MLEFTKYQQAVAFVGYELGGVTALGAYRYLCDSPPPPEPEEEENDDDDVTDSEGTGEGENNGGSGGGTVDPNNPIDEDNGGRETTDPDDTYEPPEIIDIEEDSTASLSVILIILICLLIPLVLILGCVVYLFRKNKKNAVATAMGRRRSSANLRKNYEK